MIRCLWLCLIVFLVLGCEIENNRMAKSIDSHPERHPSFQLRSTHNALFELFFPIEHLEKDAKLMNLANQVKDDLWAQMSSQDLLIWGYRALNILSTFQNGFHELSLDQRREKFEALEKSPFNHVRKAARFFRLYYLYSIYASELGEKLSGLGKRPELVHPDIDKYLKEKSPRLPPSPISYDPGQNLITHTEGKADVVIIGSGPAGSVIAHELTQAGFNVVLLEQGSFVLPGAADTRRILNLHEGFGMRTSTDGGLIFRNGNAVGGGTAINVDLAFSPMRPSIVGRIEEWRKKGFIGPQQFSASDMKRAYQWVSQKIGTRALQENEINGNNRILWEGARLSNRTPSLYDLNTFAPGHENSPVINKKSSVETFLIPALENKSHPLVIIPGAKVKQITWIDHKKSQAMGVEFEKVATWNSQGSLNDPHQLNIPVGQRVRINASHVILAAGTLGSPAILLRSGLSLPQIGKGIVAHPSIPLLGVFPKTIKAWEGTPASVFVDDQALSHGTILESMYADVSFVSMMLPGRRDQIYNTVRDLPRVGGFGVLLIDNPDNSNRISLNSQDNPEIHYKLSEQDAQRFRLAIAEAGRMMFRAGATKVFLPTNELSRTEFSSIQEINEIEKNLRFIPNRTTVTSAHLQSSCKMGKDPRTSVVDQNFRVWKTKNVYVVDSSVFPSSVGANPMQTIYTMAKIFSEEWISKQKRGTN